MRVIAGSRRSLPLSAPKGNDTRPTEDRTKETLFNVLQNYIFNGDFLDLFSGSGAIAIEALSRGVNNAILVEKDKNAIECIKKNLEFTKFTEQAVLMEKDVFVALDMILDHEPFGVIFMDPPYMAGVEEQIIGKLARMHYVDEYTVIVIEAALKTDLSFICDYNFEIFKEKNYKTNKHVFIRRK